MTISGLKSLRWKLLEKRGDRGLREVAKEIGIGHSTLHSIERGHINSTMEIFVKICKWLDIDPGEVLKSTSVENYKRIE